MSEVASRKEYQRQYYLANREKLKARSAQWYAENRDQGIASRKAYAEEHRERLAAISRERWATHYAGKPRKNIDPVKSRERSRRWKQANPEVVLEQSNRRRARKLNAPAVEKIDRASIIARDSSRCHLCGKKVHASDIHLDHLVPLSKGGEHTARNLAVAHSRCNMIRSDGRLPAQLLLIG